MTVNKFGIVELPSADSAARSAVSKVTEPLAAARRELATQWMTLPPADILHHYGDRLGHIHRTIRASGLRETWPSAADRAFISDLKAELRREPRDQVSPGKLLAAMLFLYPHQLPYPYEAGAIPPWLLRDYMQYALAGPPMFHAAGEADAYYDYFRRWTDYLHRQILAHTSAQSWLPNAESELWRSVGQLYAQAANLIPLYFNRANLKEVYRQRAAVMESTLRAANSPINHVFAPRAERRRLRLGILAAHYSPQTETYATLPVYRHLDRSRFEVILFSLAQTNHRLEQFCARHADRFVVLPQPLPARLQAVRAADLDLLFVGTNVTAVTNELAVLALHRLARVQIAGVCSCTTTGMRNVDYYLSGRLSEPEDAQSHYTERLVMVDGPAHCYDFGDEAIPPAKPMSRDDLGIPKDAVVFVSGANFYKILPELEHTWARILSAVPGSRLVLYPFNPNWSNDYPIGPFTDRLTAAMAEHDIDASRLLLFGSATGRGDVFQRLGLGDIYLDSFPFSGATSLLDPLEIGLPPVVMDGVSFRTLVAPALLRSLEINELIARDSDTYVALAVELASDAARRDRLRARIRMKMDAVPKFLDAKWYGEQVSVAFDSMWKDHQGAR